MEIDDRADGYQLDVWVLVKYRRENISDEINALSGMSAYDPKDVERLESRDSYLLNRPATNEDEKLSLRVDLQTSPFLGLSPEITSTSLVLLVDCNDLFGLCLRVPRLSIAWIRIGKLADFLQTPEDGISGVRTRTVLIRHAHCTEAFLVYAKIAGTGV